MIGLAMSESSHQPGIVSEKNSDGTRDWGLLQINEDQIYGSKNIPNPQCTWAGNPNALLNPKTNCSCAYAVYVNAANTMGNGFAPWRGAAYYMDYTPCNSSLPPGTTSYGGHSDDYDDQGGTGDFDIDTVINTDS